MKKLTNCVVENCVPTPSSCITWNGGDIEYLGICNGDSLNNIVWEIVSKLEDIAGEDTSEFDLDSLLDLCNLKAPTEVSLISILNVLKQNNICLKDYIDTLSERVNDLSLERKVTVNLKCYQDYDNLGNSLQITRDELDQLVINELCNSTQQISSLSGKVVNLQQQIDNINNNKVVEELSFSTCVDGATKPTSSQVKSIASAHCALESSLGDPSAIASALSKTPADFNTKFGLILGWDATPSNLAESYGNLLIAFNNVMGRLENIENNCCAVTCDDVKLGFSVALADDGESITLLFSAGAGTSIPVGMNDLGSTGTIKDSRGVVYSFNLSIANNAEIEVPINLLDRTKELEISITAKLGNAGLVCQKCLNAKMTPSGACAFCEITNSSSGTVVIVYEEHVGGGI